MKIREIDKIIAANLKRLRHLAGLTQDKLGEKINVDGVYIAQIEGCRIGMGKETMFKLCRALGARPYMFYIEDDTPILKDEAEEECIEDLRALVGLGLTEDVRRYIKYRITEAQIGHPQGEGKDIKKQTRRKTA